MVTEGIIKMTKNISKDQIIDVTLELINAKQSIADVNLRNIARILGCAHTNIYNYFNDFNDVLWQSVEAALLRFLDYVTHDLDEIHDNNLKLEQFFLKILDFYLQNKGYFKLIWFEQIKGARPQHTHDTVVQGVNVLTDIVYELYKDTITKEQAHYILHNVHCYLHGEFSIFIAGRGLIQEEEDFKIYVVKECKKMINLLVSTFK